jgi:biopolymer transport protein ExbB/TolQ
VIFASIISFTGSISLGVVLLGLFGAAFAIWRTQSISALRQANDDLRKDVADWKARYEDQVAKVAELTEQCHMNQVEIARLQERTDTSALAKEVVVAAFRDEMRVAIGRLEEHDARKLELLKQQGSMIETLISRDPSLRTRAGDH